MALIKTNARGQSSNLGRRNMLRNGAINVEQRGTTFSQTTGQVYTLDGFLATVGSSFNMDTTVTQSSTVPTGEGFTKAIKVTPDSVVSSSGSDNGGIAQRLEVQNVNHLGWGTSSAKNLTLSFWVRSSKTGIYCVQLQQNVAAAGTEVYSHVKEYTIATTDTWQKVILTFSGNTTQSAAGADAADGLRVNWWLVCGSNDHTAADSWLQSGSYLATSNQVDFMDNTSNTWYMTGCQLEAGDTATDFEHRSYGEELALCQRYYENLMTKEGQSMLISAWAYSVGQVQGVVRFAVDKRATPTMGYEVGIAYQGPNQTARTDVTPLFYIPSIKSVMVYANNGVSVTVGQGTNLVNRDNGTGMIFADAEL